MKNQQVLGKHPQPFKFPKAKSQPYSRPKREPKPLPWQNSDIKDAHKIPGVPAVDFENPNSNTQPSRQFFPNDIIVSRGRGGFTRGRGFNGGRGGPGYSSGYFRGQGRGRGHRGHLGHEGSINSLQPSTSNLYPVQGCSNDLAAINDLIHEQAALAQLKHGFTGSRGGSRGRGWRPHPYM